MNDAIQPYRGDYLRPLSDAVRLMDEENAEHLVVVDRERPVGVISTLDVAGAAAWGRKK
jgi:CBS domain-containing protein